MKRVKRRRTGVVRLLPPAAAAVGPSAAPPCAGLTGREGAQAAACREEAAVTMATRCIQTEERKCRVLVSGRTR